MQMKKDSFNYKSIPYFVEIVDYILGFQIVGF